ncbi:MAG: tetratricopeptide repeat protein [Proteobacteria bacterium]|nr:tetratricopeptide repeat protein [Pseudomonadota bacterium]
MTAPTLLQIVPTLAGGGIARATLDTAQAVIAAGGSAIVASPGGPMVADLLRLRASHIELPPAGHPLWARLTLPGKLAASLGAARVSLIQARSPQTAWVASALARRLGWNAEALNTPSHVLVRLGPLDSPILIDPFHGGQPIGDETLDRLLRQSVGPSAPVDPGHIAPLPNRLVLVRLLLNQATRAEQGGDIARAIAVYQRVVDVAPSYAQGWWDLARLQQGIGETDEARSSLSAMLEITRDAEARAKILETLGALSGR